MRITANTMAMVRAQDAREAVKRDAVKMVRRRCREQMLANSLSPKERRLVR